MQQRKVVKLQRMIGNRAVQRIMSAPSGRIQRDDPPAAATTYNVPEVFDDINRTARTRYEAVVACILMVDRLSSLRTRLAGGEGTAQIDRVLPTLNSMSDRIHASENPTASLTVDDIGQLSIVGGYASTAYETGLNTLRVRLRNEVQPLTQAPDLSGLNVIKSHVAERLHSAFNNGGSSSSVAQLRSTMEAIDGYRGHVDRVISWGTTLTSLFSAGSRASEFMTSLGERSATLRTGVERLTQVVTTADALRTLLGSTDTGEAQEGIARFRASLDLIDVGMSFASAVPLMGALWSNYYAPMTRAILNGLQRIYDARDREGRETALYEWMTGDSRPSDRAPIISAAVRSFFPGGQPVLNFMYAVVNNLDPEVTPSVERYFVDNAGRFNAGLESSARLGTESDSTWYDPTTWGSAERAPGLLRWVRQNKNTVWAQLYGDMAHDLRGWGN
ncbi:MAG: hypothetical protein KME04_09915 [Pleurocapsa minor GSE-CHR-MK-17-07R]|jgi:hypothetical protein|nr:hypothetical protein [Pleurocapsa minor GSE-CHR-MK 17-07R]